MTANPQAFSFFLYVDGILALIAVFFPGPFVHYSSMVVELTGLERPHSLAFSYGIVLCSVGVFASLVRRRGGDDRSRGGLLLSLLVLLMALAFTVSSKNTFPVDLTVEEVCSPYFSYLISVVFCLGVGYALADFIGFLFFGSKKI